MHDLRAIANYFIGKAIEDGVEISPMKLQKLLFFAYGIFLTIKGEPLFSERFEAWRWGPVISSLYHQLKGYGSRSIDRYLSDLDLATGEKLTPMVSEDEELMKFLSGFWAKYKDYSAVRLSNATHLPNTPWAKTLESGKTVISDEFMREYFGNHFS